MTPRSKPRQWRMNSPSRWPLDPRRQQAPRPRPGRFAGRRTPHDPHPHQPPTHGGDLRPWHGTRPPLARRWRRAWLPSALRLDGLRRPDRHSPHHGPRLAVCRVVDCRNEGITTISPAPTPFRPGRGRRKIRARRWPRPVSRPKARTPLRRLRAGGEGAAHKRPCARETCEAQQSVGAQRRRHAERAPPQGAGLVGLRPGLLPQVARKRAVLDAGGSSPVRHEGRLTDTPPDPVWSFHTTPHARGRLLRQGRLRPCLRCCPCPCQGAGR